MYEPLSERERLFLPKTKAYPVFLQEGGGGGGHCHSTQLSYAFKMHAHVTLRNKTFCDMEQQAGVFRNPLNHPKEICVLFNSLPLFRYLLTLLTACYLPNYFSLPYELSTHLVLHMPASSSMRASLLVTMMVQKICQKIHKRKIYTSARLP